MLDEKIALHSFLLVNIRRKNIESEESIWGKHGNDHICHYIYNAPVIFWYENVANTVFSTDLSLSFHNFGTCLRRAICANPFFSSSENSIGVGNLFECQD